MSWTTRFFRRLLRTPGSARDRRRRVVRPRVEGLEDRCLPTINVTMPGSFAAVMNTNLSISASFTDNAYMSGRNYIASISWGDNTSGWGSVTTSQPQGSTLQGSVQALHSYTAAGTFTVHLTVTAVGMGSGSGSALSTVTILHSAPSVTSPGTQTNAEGASISLQVSATDADGYTPLTYAASGLPAGLSTSSSGLISGSVSYSAAETNNGSYTVTVTATDSVGISGSATFLWRVSDSNGIPAVTRPANQQNAEGQTVSLQVAASDPDGEAVTYSAAGLPAGLAINSNSGLISGTVSYSAAETSGGSYTVTVTATDNQGASGTATFSWFITDTNRPPTLTNPGNQTNAEGSAVSLQVSASDPDTPDGDVLTYAASGLPAGLGINRQTGLISGTVAYSAAETSGGQYTVLIIVSDSHGASDSKTFTWAVTDTNLAPTLTAPSAQQNAEGDSVSLQVTASDGDGDALTYSATGLPLGVGINSATGQISGTIAYSAAETNWGSYTVTVTATDPLGLSASAAFAWTVTDTNRAPSITSPGSQSSVEGATVSLQVVASDPDPEQALTYTVTGLPPGLVIGPDNGVIAGTIGTPAAGSYAVTVAVADPDGVSASTGFTWTVYPAGPPTVILTALSSNASEAGPRPGSFLVARAGDLSAPLTVSYTVSGTAVAGTDYVALPGTVTIPVGAAATLITVLPLGDRLANGPATVVATLSTAADYSIGAAAGGTVTIADLPMPTVTLVATQPSAAESGANGPVAGQFTISRTGSTALPLTVRYTVGGTATPGADYAALAGMVTIAAGATDATITVSPSGTTLPTAGGTVVLTLAASTAYAAGNAASDTVTIAAATPPTVTIDATQPDAAEWQDGDPVAGTLTVTRSGDTYAPLTVLYTVGGTASPGGQYTALPGSVTIPAGSASATITVNPLADGPGEGDTTVVVGLAASAGYVVGAAGSATVTIADAPMPVVTIVASQPNAAESGDSGPVVGQFTVLRTGGSTAADLTVSYTVGGTAVAGADYQALSGSVTIPAGSDTATISVTPTGNSLAGATETVVVTLAAASGYTAGAPNQDTVTLADSAGPTLTITASQPDAAEGASGVVPGVLTVTRSGSTSADLTIPYTVSGTAVAGTDYQALSGSVTIPAGSDSADITINPLANGNTGTPTVVVTLAANTAYTIGWPGDGTVTIAEQPLPTVTVTATDPSAAESGPDGPVDGTFTLTRTGSTDLPLTVSYTVGGTAAAGTDYDPLPGTLTIPAGAASATIDVAPLGSTLAGNVTVVVSLSADPTYVTSDPASDTVTISPAPVTVVTIVASVPNAAEEDPDTGAADDGIFTVMRTGDTSQSLTVYYTVSGTAVADSTYTALSGTLTIDAGASNNVLIVHPLADGPTDGGGTVTITLSADRAYVVGSAASDTVTIADAPPPTVGISATQADAAKADPVTGEPDDGTFTVTRTGSTDSALTVTYTVTGTATAGSDYTALSGTVTFAAGDDSATIDIAPLVNDRHDGSETVIVTLASDPSYTVDSNASSDTVTIADLPTPTVTVEATVPDAAAPEFWMGASSGLFTVSRTGPTVTDLVVSYTVGGSAVAGTDYTALSGTVTIPAGSDSATIDVTPLASGQGLADATVIVILSAEPGYAVESGSGADTATVHVRGAAGTSSLDSSLSAATGAGGLMAALQQGSPAGGQLGALLPQDSGISLTRYTVDFVFAQTQHLRESGDAQSGTWSLDETLAFSYATHQVGTTPYGPFQYDASFSYSCVLQETGTYLGGVMLVTGAIFTDSGTAALLGQNPPLDLGFSWPGGNPPADGTFTLDQATTASADYHLSGDDSEGSYSLDQAQSLHVAYTAQGSLGGGAIGTQTLDEGLDNSCGYSEAGTFGLGSDGVVVAVGGTFTQSQASSDFYQYAAAGRYSRITVAGTGTGSGSGTRTLDSGTFTLTQQGTDYATATATGAFGISQDAGGVHTSDDGTFTAGQGGRMLYGFTCDGSYDAGGGNSGTYHRDLGDIEAAAATSDGRFSITNGVIQTGGNYTLSASSAVQADFSASGSYSTSEPTTKSSDQGTFTLSQGDSENSAYAEGGTFSQDGSGTGSQSGTFTLSQSSAPYYTFSSAGHYATNQADGSGGGGGSTTGVPDWGTSDAADYTRSLGAFYSASYASQGSFTANTAGTTITTSTSTGTETLAAESGAYANYDATGAYASANGESGSYTRHEGSTLATAFESADAFTAGGGANGSTSAAAGTFSSSESWDSRAAFDAAGTYHYFVTGMYDDAGTFTRDVAGDQHASYQAAGTFASSTGGPQAGTTVTATFNQDQGDSGTYSYAADGVYGATGVLSGGTATYHRDAGQSGASDYATAGTFTVTSTLGGATTGSSGTFSFSSNGDDSADYVAGGTFWTTDNSDTVQGVYTWNQRQADHQDGAASGSFSASSSPVTVQANLSGTYSQNQSTDSRFRYTAAGSYDQNAGGGNTDGADFTLGQGSVSHTAVGENGSFSISAGTAGTTFSASGSNSFIQTGSDNSWLHSEGDYTSTADGFEDEADYTRDDASGSASTYASQGTFRRGSGPAGPWSSASGTFSLDQASGTTSAYRADGDYTAGTAADGSAGDYTRVLTSGSNDHFAIPAGSYSEQTGVSGNSSTAGGPCTRDQGGYDSNTYVVTSGTFNSSHGPLGSVSGTFTEVQTSANTAQLHETGQARLTGNDTSIDGTYTAIQTADRSGEYHERGNGTLGSGSTNSTQTSHQAEIDRGTETAGGRRLRGVVVDSSSDARWDSSEQFSLAIGGNNIEVDTADGTSFSRLHEDALVLSQAGQRYFFNSYSFQSGLHRHQHTLSSGFDSSGTWQSDSDSTRDSTRVQGGAGTSGSYTDDESGSSWSHLHMVWADGHVTDIDGAPAGWHTRWVGDLDLSSGTPVVTSQYGGSVGDGPLGEQLWSFRCTVQAGVHQLPVWADKLREAVEPLVPPFAKRWVQTYTLLREAGHSKLDAAGWASLFVLADEVGVTDLNEAWVGTEVFTNEPLSTGQRWFRGARGTVKLVVTGANIYGAAGALGRLGALTRGCFAAGTPLLTPTGDKLIEQFRPGDWILTAPEDDPAAAVEAKQVEEVFTNHARLLHLHVAGHVIRTTAAHPFWVQGKGWTAAKHLRPGELLRSHDGRWMSVEDLYDSGEDAPVYNLRIADYHTYFVGAYDWTFSAWAHNACDVAAALNAAERYGARNLGNGWFQYPSRRLAQQAASEIAGDLGAGARAIRAFEFRGGPWWMQRSQRVIGRVSADGSVGWRNDFLGHPEFGMGPHFNVWGPGGFNFHLFY